MTQKQSGAWPAGLPGVFAADFDEGVLRVAELADGDALGAFLADMGLTSTKRLLSKMSSPPAPPSAAPPPYVPPKANWMSYAPIGAGLGAGAFLIAGSVPPALL